MEDIDVFEYHEAFAVSLTFILNINTELQKPSVLFNVKNFSVLIHINVK